MIPKHIQDIIDNREESKEQMDKAIKDVEQAHRDLEAAHDEHINIMIEAINKL